MATNNMASDAFKRAQNLLSPGYNKLDTFEAVTTLSKDDAQDLARAMKLDAGVTGYGNTPFKDNQASMGSYFPSIEDQTAIPRPLEEDPDEIVYKDKFKDVMETERQLRELYDTTGKSIDKGVDWLGDKYNEIFGTDSDDDINSKATADVPTNVNIYNNPGSIEKTSIKWDGEGKKTYNNGRFTTFDTPEAGLTAMTKDLTTKLKRHDGDLKKMIENYASEEDGNDTAAYLKVVQQYAGKKKVYTLSDIDNIVKGFIAMENKPEAKKYYFKILESMYNGN